MDRKSLPGTQMTSVVEDVPLAEYIDKTLVIDFGSAETGEVIPRTQALSPTQMVPTASAESSKARLVNIIDGNIMDFSPTLSEIIIGRHPSCQIILQDVMVSGKHVRIFRDSYSYCVVDTSANGTFVCGSRLNKGETRRLKSGDEISVVQNSFKPCENAKYVYVFSESPCAVITSDSPIHLRYDLGRSIGKGNFSEVVSGISRQSGDRVAIKIIDTVKTQQFSKKSKSATIDIQSESRLLGSFSHPNILRFIGLFSEATSSRIFLVTELMEGGDLLNHLLEFRAFTETAARHMFTQICDGLQYLHNRGIIHRDLKPENILLDRTRKIPKISDFGLAREAAPDVTKNMRTYCGTPHYFAPEMFKLQRHEIDGYGAEVDIWSLGVILYVLLSARPPFSDEDLASQVEGGLYDFDCSEFDNVSEDAKALIAGCMQVDPSKRFNVSSVISHPWLMKDDLNNEKPRNSGGSKRKVLVETNSRLDMPPPSSSQFKRVKN